MADDIKELQETSPSHPLISGQDAVIGDVEEAMTRLRIYARKVLGSLGHLRIEKARIKPLEDIAPRSGGKADIEAAVLVPAQSSNYLKTKDAEYVAVKKLRFDTDTDDDRTLSALAHEVEFISNLSHSNVVKIVGFVEDVEQRIAWMVFSWEKNGNLREFVRSANWELPERLSLIYDVAKGLSYLHGRTPPICHGDLKSLNILVNSKNRAIITDFGSARTIDSASAATVRSAHSAAMGFQHRIMTTAPTLESLKVELASSGDFITMTGPAWSIRWAAPELLEGELPSLASDIWALGWICWEAITENFPFDEENDVTSVALHITKGDLPAFTDVPMVKQVSLLCDLMGRCWKLNANERPRAMRCQQEISFMHPVIPSSSRVSGSATTRSSELLCALGRIQLQNGMVSEAEKYCQESLVVAKSVEDKEGRARALSALGDVYHMRSEYSKAEELYVAARNTYSQIGDQNGFANSAKGLGDVCLMRSEYSKAEELYVEARNTYSQIGDQNGFANSTKGLGDVYHMRSDYSKAEELYIQARDIYSQIWNQVGFASSVKGLGDVYHMRSEYFKAEESYIQARDTYSKIQDQNGFANSTKGLGDVYHMRSEYSKAEELYIQARDTYSQIQDQNGFANSTKGLGDVYHMRSEYSKAEELYIQARNTYSQIGDQNGFANSTKGLGDVYHMRSEYSKAEELYIQARDIYSQIGNRVGFANSVKGLGDVYHVRSEYSKAEELYIQGRDIYSQIGNQVGFANSVKGLGDVYHMRSEYSKAEESYIQARDTYSHYLPGTCIGIVVALVALGYTYDAQERDSEAEQTFKDALERLSRIDRELTARNVPNDPGDTSDAEPWDPEDEEVLNEASGIHPRHPTETRTRNEQEDEEQPRQIPLAEPRNLYEVEMAATISVFDDGTSASGSRQNPDRSNYSESESLPVSSTQVYEVTEANLPEPTSPPPPRSPQPSATSHNPPHSLQLPSRRMYQASASSQLASVADPVFHDDQQEGFLTEQFVTINYVPGSAAEELVDLIQALGRAAPQAVRNKHKIYSVLRAAHDACNHILETGKFSGGQPDTDVKQLLERMEQYYVVLHALEETLLRFAEILPSEITTFGPELYSSWLQSRSMITAILNKLCHPPFPEISYKTQDIAKDLFFDDCSWLSRLLYSGIDAEVAVQFANPPMAHPVLAVINGLHYLESQMKYGEQTRELVLDISTLLAQALVAASTDGDHGPRQGELFPRHVADRDWLIQAVADSFNTLDLDTTLEPPTAQEIASKWTDIKTSFTSRGMSGLEKMI